MPLSHLKRLARLLPSPLQRMMRYAMANYRDRETIAALSGLNTSVHRETPACSICGRHEVRVHSRKNGFRVVECVADGLLFVSPRPADLVPYYDSRYYRGGVPGVYESYATHAGEMKQEWQRRLAALECTAAGGRRLLDVGAATGDFVALAVSSGWEARGIELSEWAAAQARETHNVDVVSGSLPDARFRAGEYDVVTMWDCIEHLSDPGAVLGAICQLLHGDGLLALSTGAIDHRDPFISSGWYYPPWHLYYFSRESMTLLLERAGFHMIEFVMQDEESPYAIMIVTARPRHPHSD